jgi:hypothetical protein
VIRTRIRVSLTGVPSGNGYHPGRPLWRESQPRAGIQPRSRALVSEPQAAEGLYHEAIDRLGRTQLRPELARGHLLYGEWLRRGSRRVDARAQLRAAHEMLDAMAWRRSRNARAGSCWPPARPSAGARSRLPARLPRRRPTSPGWRGTAGPTRDRCPAVPQRAHGRVAPAQGIYQAGHPLLAQRRIAALGSDGNNDTAPSR